MNFRIPEREREARRWARVALTAILIGVVLRGIVGLWLHPPLDYVYSDMRGYVDRAIRVASGGHLTRFDAFFPPGTHLLLAVPLKVFGTHRGGLWAASVVWFALSSAVPLLAWRSSLRVMPAKAAAITSVLCAVWPMYVAYGAFFMSEIPATFSLLLTLWLAFKVREASGGARVAYGIAGGLAAGAALVVRPQLVLNVVIAAGTMIGGRRSARVAAAALLGLAVPIAGAFALNAHAAGRFVGFSENGGLNFFQGHCPVKTILTQKPGVGALEFASPVAVQQDRGNDYTIDGHMAWEQSIFFRLGLNCIRNDGVKHLEVVARNVADLGITSVPWPASNEQPMRWFVRPANLIYSWALPSIVVFALALGIHRRSGERKAAGYAGQARGTTASSEFGGTMLLVVHLICVVPTAVIFYGDPRFRVPYDVFGLGLLAILLGRIGPFGRNGRTGTAAGVVVGRGVSMERDATR